jgi:hypothetical protein
MQSGLDRFVGHTVDTLTATGRTATWSGTGSWNGRPGFTFTAKAVDAGRRSGSEERSVMSDSSSIPDRLALTIRNSFGAIVWGADWQLLSGEIAVRLAGSDREDGIESWILIRGMPSVAVGSPGRTGTQDTEAFAARIRFLAGAAREADAFIPRGRPLAE